MCKHIRIVLADDHAIFLDGLKMLLSTQSQFKVVGSANDGQEALRLLENLEVDVLITDIHMPALDGVGLIRTVVKDYPHVKCIALTMLNEKLQIQQVLESGADAYLLKNTQIDELRLAIDCVTLGNTYLSKQVNTILAQKHADMDDVNKLLTGREHDVLEGIVDGLSSKMIAEQLKVSIDTIKFHRKNLLSKLNQPNAASLVRFALENGVV